MDGTLGIDIGDTLGIDMDDISFIGLWSSFDVVSIFSF